MSSKAMYKGDKLTAEGLGGENIQGLADPRTHEADLPNVGESKPSDPEWVERKSPEEMPKRTPAAATGGVAGEGVGYDPASASVAMMEGSGVKSSGASASQTGLLPRSHEMAGKGDAEVMGVVGADTHAVRRAGEVGASKHGVPGEEGVGKSAETRKKAGTEAEGAVQGEELHRGLDVQPPVRKS